MIFIVIIFVVPKTKKIYNLLKKLIQDLDIKLLINFEYFQKLLVI